MSSEDKAVRGRGAVGNPTGRFEPIRIEWGEERENSEAPKTLYFRDKSQTILAYNDSPDLGFSVSINPYRGCEHGCIYCYARPTHEYLGYSAGLDFETRIMVKENAPELLRRELSAPRWKPQVIAMSGVTDCYQPVEKKLAITRDCLKVLAEFGNPVGIVTKNALVQRDLDVLADMGRRQAAVLMVSLTTLDMELARRMEPRTSMPGQRLATIEAAKAAGLPVGVLIAPVILGLNDHEIPSLLNAASQAGATFATFVMLRLPYGLKDLFGEWLDCHYPSRREKIMTRLASLRGGKWNDSRFGVRMRGEGVWASHVEGLFQAAAAKNGMGRRGPELSVQGFRVPQRDEKPLAGGQQTFPW